MQSTVIPIAMTLAIVATCQGQITSSKLRQQKFTQPVVESDSGNGVRSGNVSRVANQAASDEVPDYALPSGALPSFGIARLVHGNEVEITEFITVYEMARVIIEGGPETEERTSPLTIDYTCTHDLTGVTAKYARGQNLGRARLRHLLKTPTLFVMSSDNRPIDSLFLSFLRPNLLFLDIPDHYASNRDWDEGRVLEDDELDDEIPLAPEQQPRAPSAGPLPARANP